MAKKPRDYSVGEKRAGEPKEHNIGEKGDLRIVKYSICGWEPKDKAWNLEHWEVHSIWLYFLKYINRMAQQALFDNTLNCRGTKHSSLSCWCFRQSHVHWSCDISRSEFYHSLVAFNSVFSSNMCMQIILYDWLVGFYGISTFVGYLIPNSFLCK